ncbi:MAG: STAS domain-containing protein [Eubacterium sp.]|nr:STAS domain-containing protein [Eubacterium sp.]
MEINKKKEGKDLTVEVSGRVDTVTAPEFEQSVMGDLDGVENLTVDLKNLEYMSSAGLRVMLALYKKMSTQGSMVVTNVSDTISEIFEVTGFNDILNIQ